MAHDFGAFSRAEAWALQRFHGAHQSAGEPFGWWLVDNNGIGRLSRTPPQDTIEIYRSTPGYSAIPLYDAQPSPGGQGDALTELTAKWRRESKERFGKNEFSVVAESLDVCAHELEAALAANRPVVLVDSVVDCEEDGTIIGVVVADGAQIPAVGDPLYAVPPAQAVDLAPRPMDTAPTDGTLVRLLVNFTSNPTEDSHGPAWTIGSNNDSNVMADERVGWQFAGWCWDHDHFTEGEGTPVGWLPLVGAPAQAVPDTVQAIIREYLDAEEAFRAATRNNWGPDKRLNHADPLVIRLREARVALRKMAWDATEAQAEVKP